jgi:hypothetical protein
LKLSISIASAADIMQAQGTATETSSALVPAMTGTTIGAVPDQECVRIGPDGPDASIFELAVTLVSASSLVACIPRQQLAAWRRERFAFWIAYVLFDVDIMTAPFSLLSRPNFPAIQDAFKLRGTLSNVTRFLRDAPLVLHLYGAPRSSSLERTRATTRHLKPIASASIAFEHLCNKISVTHPHPFARATSSGAHPLNNDFTHSASKEQSQATRQRQPASGVAPQVPSVAIDLALTASSDESQPSAVVVDELKQRNVSARHCICYEFVVVV